MKTEDIKKMGLAFQQVLEKKKKLDPVDKDELDGTHADRDDKDIDNDGDTDSTDKYLHKRRKAITKATSETFEPHMMYDPKTGEGTMAKVEADHIRMKKMGYSHEKPTNAKESTGFPIYDRIQEKASLEEEPDENKKMALQKAMQKAAKPSAKGKAAVTLAPGDPTKKMKENDQVVLDDDEPNMKKKKNQETAKMNPKISDKTDIQKEANQELEMVTQYSRPNSVSAMREAMTQMWQEAADRNKHYAKASDPETQNDMLKGQGAKDMAADFQSAIAKGDADTTNLEKVFTVNSAAQKAGPNPKHRSNDQKTGDKSIVK